MVVAVFLIKGISVPRYNTRPWHGEYQYCYLACLRQCFIHSFSFIQISFLCPLIQAHLAFRCAKSAQNWTLRTEVRVFPTEGKLPLDPKNDTENSHLIFGYIQSHHSLELKINKLMTVFVNHDTLLQNWHTFSSSSLFLAFSLVPCFVKTKKKCIFLPSFCFLVGKFKELIKDARSVFLSVQFWL